MDSMYFCGDNTDLVHCIKLHLNSTASLASNSMLENFADKLGNMSFMKVLLPKVCATFKVFGRLFKCLLLPRRALCSGRR